MAQLPFGYKEQSRSHPTVENYNFDNGSITATRVFEGPWLSRQRFIFGTLLRPLDTVGGVTLLPSPAPYPDANIAFARSVAVLGKGKSYVKNNGMISWDRAELTVNYSTASGNVAQSIQASNDNESFTNAIYIDESVDFSAEQLSIPGESILIDGFRGGGVDKVSLTIIFADIILTQTQLIRPLWGNITLALGKVNRQVFVTPSGFMAKAETLRYDGPAGNTKVNIKNGTGEINERSFPLPVWEMSHMFKYNPNSWNKLPDKEGIFKSVVKFGDGKPLFALVDMYSIFGGKFDTDKLNCLDDALETLAELLAGETSFVSPQLEIEIAAAQRRVEECKSDLGFRT